MKTFIIVFVVLSAFIQGLFLTPASYAETPPKIISIPLTQTVENQAYSYDVESTGNPVPTYALAVAPYGMTIDSASGLISWNPSVPGTFDVTAQAVSDAGVDSQKFNVNVQPATGYVWPGTKWPTATPAQMNMDEAKLIQARDYALTGGGSGYIIRHGRLVMSWGNPTTLYDLKSTTKSIGVTALGLAIKDGRMTLDDKAQDHHSSFGIPPDSNAATGWLDDITLRHLATQTAGFDKPGGYISLLYQPGTTWVYSDGGPNWLAETVTLTFTEDLNSLMFRRVFTPIGISGSALVWRSNIYRSDTIYGIKNREFGSGISANVDAMARIGYLYLRQGNWNGTEILQQSFIDQVRTSVPGVAGLPVATPGACTASDHYGLLWYNNADKVMPNTPADAYFSWGLYESLIIIIPSLDIVAARAGDSWPSNPFCYNAIQPFLDAISESVLDIGGKPIKQPPAAPSGLTATFKSTTQINLAWIDNANNEDGFRVERCTGSNCTNFSLIATVGPNVNTYTNTGLNRKTTYSYRVRAYNAAGDSGYSNIAYATTSR